MSNPLWINEDGGQPEYTAQSLRLSMSGLLTKGVSDRLGARPGVFPNGRDAVSLSGVQVTVHDCNVVLNPALSAQDGPYIAHFTEHTHTLDPGDGSNARIDIVVARVYDDDHDGSGQRQAVTELITGNPGPSPAQPAVPAGALLLARIDVPADGAGDASLSHIAPATVASGGVLPVRSADDLPTTGLPEGAYADLAGVGLLRWDGAEWQPGQDRMRLSDVALTGTVGTGTNCEIPTILRGKFRSYVLQVDAWVPGDYLKALVIWVNGDASENYRAQAQAVEPDGTVAHFNDGAGSAFPRYSYLGQFGGFTEITFRPRTLGDTALIAWTTEGWANNGPSGSALVRGGGRWSGVRQELTHFAVRTSSSSDTWSSESRATLWGLR